MRSSASATTPTKWPRVSRKCSRTARPWSSKRRHDCAGHRIPPAARSRLLRLTQPMGHRQCPCPRRSRVQGSRNDQISVELSLSHLRTIAAAVEVPVNADFEDGFARDPLGVAANVWAAVETGIAGVSIEDSSGDQATPLYDFALAVERIHAARKA